MLEAFTLWHTFSQARVGPYHLLVRQRCDTTSRLHYNLEIRLGLAHICLQVRVERLSYFSKWLFDTSSWLYCNLAQHRHLVFLCGRKQIITRASMQLSRTMNICTTIHQQVNDILPDWLLEICLLNIRVINESPSGVLVLADVPCLIRP